MAWQSGFCHLFLDELPEFGSYSLESLRQPLLFHIVNTSRTQGTLTFSANFVLVGAINSCQQGFPK